MRKLWVLSWICLLVSASSFGETLPSGAYKCFSSTASGSETPPAVPPRAIRSQYCMYQAKELGDVVFNRLLDLARNFVLSFGQNVPFDALLPQKVGTRGILWDLGDRESNEELGRRLVLNDHGETFEMPARIKIGVTIVSLQKNSLREFGLSVGSYFGTRTADQIQGGKPADFSSEITNGLLSMLGGIGNPYASFLQLGLTAQINKKRASQLIEFTADCAVGSSCTHTHSAPYYFTHPTGLDKTLDLGVTFSATPKLSEDAENIVILDSLNLTYSVKTDNPAAPVDVFKPASYRRFSMRSDDIIVIANETTHQDVRTGKLIGTGDETAHNQILITLKTDVILPEKKQEARYPGFKIKNISREMSPAEVAALPERLSLREILSSLERVCFKDALDPKTVEPICGFQITKMDRAHKDMRFRFKMASPSWVNVFSKTSGKLKFESDRERIWTLGEIFKDKGYYQIPLLDSDDKPEQYRLVIDLDESHRAAKILKKKVLAEEGLSGVEVEFGYFPGASQPIGFSKESITEID